MDLGIRQTSLFHIFQSRLWIWMTYAIEPEEIGGSCFLCGRLIICTTFLWVVRKKLYKLCTDAANGNVGSWKVSYELVLRNLTFFELHGAMIKNMTISLQCSFILQSFANAWDYVRPGTSPGNTDIATDTVTLAWHLARPIDIRIWEDIYIYIYTYQYIHV